MGIIRKILIFLVFTAGIIYLGKLAPKVVPRLAAYLPWSSGQRSSGSGSSDPSQSGPRATDRSPDAAPSDSSNALPEISEDTSGGRWHEKLFSPLLRANGLNEKNLKQKKGYWELMLPKGKPIHEYALQIEQTCRHNGVTVEKGVELRPTDRAVEYLLESHGQHIKLRASLGKAVMAGAAKLAVVFIELDSLRETQLAALEAAKWSKTFVINPYSPNIVLKKLRYTVAANELMAELPLEPSQYPFIDPGKHALFIHHSKEDVSRILTETHDSLPKAIGFATKYGNRAIENLPLLEKIFKFTATNNLAFLDLTGSPRSLARQAATAQGARCRVSSPFRDSLHIEEELARKAVLAQKTGEGVLVLPYTVTGFKRLEKALAASQVHFNELGLELVTLSSLSVKAAADTSAKSK